MNIRILIGSEIVAGGDNMLAAIPDLVAQMVASSMQAPSTPQAEPTSTITLNGESWRSATRHGAPLFSGDGGFDVLSWFAPRGVKNVTPTDIVITGSKPLKFHWWDAIDPLPQQQGRGSGYSPAIEAWNRSLQPAWTLNTGVVWPTQLQGAVLEMRERQAPSPSQRMAQREMAEFALQHQLGPVDPTGPSQTEGLAIEVAELTGVPSLIRGWNGFANGDIGGGIFNTAVGVLSLGGWGIATAPERRMIARELSAEARVVGGTVGPGTAMSSHIAEEVVSSAVGRYGRFASADEMAMEAMARYQSFYDEGYAIFRGRADRGALEIPEGVHANTIIGRETDAYARNAMEAWAAIEGLGDDAIRINRRLYNPANDTAYRIPDIYIPDANLIVDGTIGWKWGTTPQVYDFRRYSGADIVIMRPLELGGPYTPLRRGHGR